MFGLIAFIGVSVTLAVYAPLSTADAEGDSTHCSRTVETGVAS